MGFKLHLIINNKGEIMAIKMVLSHLLLVIFKAAIKA